MPPKPWPDLPPDREHFERPPREYGILPFWFLNGELDPDCVLRENVVLHDHRHFSAEHNSAAGESVVDDVGDVIPERATRAGR